LRQSCYLKASDRLNPPPQPAIAPHSPKQPSNRKRRPRAAAALNSDRFDPRRTLEDDSAILFSVDINASAAIWT
jgi:hypothetical protein